MMHKQLIFFFLLSLIYIVNGDYQSSSGNSNYQSSSRNNNYQSSSTNNNYQSSNCKRFENKIYQVTVTFPSKKPFHAVLRFLPNNAFDELFGIDNDTSEQVGVNMTLSHRIGYYKCLPKNYVRFTGLGYLYKTPGVPFLADDGGIVIHDYYFRFSNNDKTCKGVVKFTVFKSGTNPFTTTDKPTFEGDIGKVTCELLTYRTYYDLSNEL